jgi:hypothetical protein
MLPEIIQLQMDTLLLLFHVSSNGHLSFSFTMTARFFLPVKTVCPFKKVDWQQ